VKRAVITNLKSIKPHYITESYPVWEDIKGLVSDIKYVTMANSDSKPTGYTDLSTTEVIGSNTGIANCYAIPAGSSNTQWCIPVKNAKGWIQENTYICFTVKAGTYGNALLGFSTADEANSQTSSYSTNYAEKAWSWHIWVPSITPAEETLTNGNTELDMNLGSIDKKSIQCNLYQWGRKDPFSNLETAYFNVDGTQVQKDNVKSADKVTGSDYKYVQDDSKYRDGIYDYKHPDTYIGVSSKFDWLTNRDDTRWGYPDYNKTVNDPCPAGYQVIYSEKYWDNVTYYKGKNLGDYFATTTNTKPSESSTEGAAFFPFSMSLNSENGTNTEANDHGFMWTAVPWYDGNRADAYMMTFSNNWVTADLAVKNDNRSMGFSVRCVKAK
jgi:uncharacterized protein (TIGR02145 family)